MNNADLKKILSIAGSDSSGGAGIQADIKTITAHKMYAMTAITALTAQNTLGVYDILTATPDFVASEIDAVCRDIFPDAVKIGMVADKDIISIIAEKLKEYQPPHIVIDPVMVSTSGSHLLEQDAIDTLIRQLLPLGQILTPNLPEAEVLCGFKLRKKDDLPPAAAKIAVQTGTSVLIKGGHLKDSACDLLWTEEKTFWFEEAHIDNPNTHGTGCTLSSAIACQLAKGLALPEAVRAAKEYISGALRAGLDLGHGSGPLNHIYAL